MSISRVLVLSAFCLGLNLHARATEAQYNDLGEFAGADDSFWKTTDHAQVTVDEAAMSLPAACDPRPGCSAGIVPGAEIDPRGKTSEESGVIAFVSTILRGLLFMFR